MEVVTYKGFNIEIDQDVYACNPIEEFDGNVKYCLFHNKYNLQNDTDLDSKDYNSWEELEQALIENYKPLAVLPVYMYDHSGQTIRTFPYSCRWDSGQLGFAFIDAHTLEEWGSAETKVELLENYIRDNVQLYDDYISGNVYSYYVEDVESCSGFYGETGYKEALLGAKTSIDYCVREAQLQRNEKVKVLMQKKVPLTKKLIILTAYRAR